MVFLLTGESDFKMNAHALSLAISKPIALFLDVATLHMRDEFLSMCSLRLA